MKQQTSSYKSRYTELLEKLFEEQRKYILELKADNKRLKELVDGLGDKLAIEMKLREESRMQLFDPSKAVSMPSLSDPSASLLQVGSREPASVVRKFP